MPEPPVRLIEVLGHDACVLRLPGKARFVRAMRVEGMHVRVEARDQLNDIEALPNSISRELRELFGEMKAVTQTHPPGVTEPEERRAVRVFEMAMVRRDLNWAEVEERIGTGVRPYF